MWRFGELPYTDAAKLTDAQKEYRAYLSTVRWRTIRTIRRAMDGQKCCMCGGKKRLEVHHKSYRNRGIGGMSGMMAEIADCITLCHNCHKKEHGK